MKRALYFAAAVLAASSSTYQYKTSDKAYYASENTINFVRPGLVVSILDADIAADGVIRARLRITDPKGLPLDRDGIVTPGPVSLSPVAGFIAHGKTQYTAYTTRTVTSPITNVTAIQPAADTGGAWEKTADGEYTYTFRTKAPASIDRSATHTIGVYGSRNLTEFDLGTNFADATYNFVPDGSQVTEIRDVVRTAACNQCHNPLSAHGGARRSVALCVMCHTPQNMDPDTGNSLDLPVMAHRIHMGADLPSVKAGTPYRIVGFNQTVFDFSDVEFPAGVNNCIVCHSKDATQSAAFLKPNRAACGACHDDVNFATGENHVDLPQVSDNQCSTCHVPQGELEYDASILGAHLTPRFSRDLPGTVFELIQVDDGVAGKRPTVTFRVKDKSGKPILPSEMTRLALVLAGPATDYASAASEDVTKAQGSTDGVYYWTFQNPIPTDAHGTFSVGIEGYRNIKLLAGTKKERTVRDAGLNQVIHFSVDGSPVAPRRKVVDIAKCNACHLSLSVHGDNRNQTVMCVLCHNPNQTDAARRPASAGPPETVDFRTMIHRIHTGKDLTRDYIVYGFGASKNDFTRIGFPGDRRDCTRCHVNGSEQLPLNENLLPVLDPRGPVSPVGPAAAACRGCHTDVATASHALAMTTEIGESCAVCHGSDAAFSVNRVHAR